MIWLVRVILRRFKDKFFFYLSKSKCGPTGNSYTLPHHILKDYKEKIRNFHFLNLSIYIVRDLSCVMKPKNTFLPGGAGLEIVLHLRHAVLVSLSSHLCIHQSCLLPRHIKANLIRFVFILSFLPRVKTFHLGNVSMSVSL